jgi:predicted dehydrogenase
MADHDPVPTSSSGVFRRDFVRSAVAAAAVGPFVIGRAPRAAAARLWPAARDPDVLTVGLIGCGGRGTGAAFNALSAEDGTVRLVAMADVFPDRLESSLAHLREALGPGREPLVDVPPERRHVGFEAAHALIGSDVDVVLLATPPHFRPAHLRAAVTAGKHVFTEKPMAVDGPGVRSVLETAALAQRQDLSLVSGFCWRYNVRHRELYRRIREGALGELRAIDSTYNASPLGTRQRRPEWSDMEFQLRNWQHFNWLAGDHVVEQAVHSLDKMGWAMGDEPPLRVTAVGGRQAREGAETGDIYDHFAAHFEYTGGVRGFHMSRQIARCSNDNSDRIYGATGVASIDTGGVGLRIEGEHPWAYEGDGNDMYQNEHDELFRAIRAGEPINDGEWMARSTLLAIMLRMAAYTGQTVSWEQALNSAETLGPSRYAFGELAVEPVPVPGRTRLI